MGNSNFFWTALFYLNKISFAIALNLVLISLVLGWIGFAVPDWLSYYTPLGYQRKFGLWNVCTLGLNFFSNGHSCSSWSSQKASNPLPDFVNTIQVLMIFGMIFLTFAVFTGIVALCLKINIFKLLPLLASILSFMSFLFILIGFSIFGGDYSQYTDSIGAYNVRLRWGFFIFIPVFIFLPIAAALFPLKTMDEYLKYKRQVENYRRNDLNRPGNISMIKSGSKVSFRSGPLRAPISVEGNPELATSLLLPELSRDPTRIERRSIRLERGRSNPHRSRNNEISFELYQVKQDKAEVTVSPADTNEHDFNIPEIRQSHSSLETRNFVEEIVNSSIEKYPEKVEAKVCIFTNRNQTLGRKERDFLSKRLRV